MSAGADDARGRAHVGSVHEETARLFAALEGAAAAWSRGDRPAGDRADAGPGPQAAGTDPQADGDGRGGHLSTTCGVCPLCLALDRLARRHPDVLAHLGDAVQALGAAVAALTAQPPGAADDGPRADRERDRVRTERIDVTD